MANMSREEIFAALFQNLIVQQTNMAFIFLGRIPHPQTNEITRDLDAAKFFIDQLEMLEFKTRNNLEKEEATLLKQSLTTLRMAFVEAVESPAPAKEKNVSPAAEQKSTEPTATPEAKADDDRKKFSKKY